VNLQDVLEEAAAELDDVEEVEAAGGVEWRRGGRAFAVAAGEAAEFRLQGAVAAAAVRTPDTHSSPRGPEWVRFTPPELDGLALDRAEAWLASAWRNAEPG
jgi:hypothetical protein